MSKVFVLEKQQKIPASLAAVWDFFSRPQNLAIITPPDMNFEILSHPQQTRMYAGQVIEYRVKPMAGIAMYWMTEITQVAEYDYFVDEQRVGPYRMWHHQHHFTEIAGGVEMIDLVHYRLPFGWIGNLAQALVIKKRLLDIFAYRSRKAEEIFGKWPVEDLA